MSIVSVLFPNPIDFKNTYGSTGVKTIETMSQICRQNTLNLAYNLETRTFTITEPTTEVESECSSPFRKEELEKLFAKHSFKGWEPVVLNDKDRHGNHLITLQETLSSFEELDKLTHTIIFGVVAAFVICLKQVEQNLKKY